MSHEEYHLQVLVCEYLEMQYKDVLFLSDTIGNIKLTMRQAVRNKKIQKDGFKCPDILILEPNKLFKGLFIELKIKSPYEKNGEIYSNKHLKGQEQSISDLCKKGYFACFAWSFEMAVNIIDAYMIDR